MYVSFVKLCWAAIEDPDLHVHGSVLPSVKTAIMNKKKLGGEFLLRGYLTRDWLAAIMQVKKIGKAELRLTLFEAVWEQLNEMLHGKNGIVDVYERQQLIAEMKEWKHQAHTRLGSKQQFLVTFTDDEILRWRTATIREHLKLITQASKNYNNIILDKDQLRITDFFVPIDFDDI